MRPVDRIALLTGGGDRPYAHGLAFSLAAAGVRADFIGSDFLDSETLRDLDEIRFLNLRGDMSPEAPSCKKAIRVFRYYARLLAYSLTSDARIFHVLWNNRFESFDRTILMGFYRLLGKRVVRTVHNVNAAERDGRDTAFNRFTLKIQYALSHHLFVHTEQMKQQLMTQFGVAEQAISVIPFGINDTVPNTGLGNGDARRRLGLAGDHRVLLFFGNIAPYKGVEILVDAFASIARDDPRYRLVIAGRPKGEEAYWEEVQRSILALGVADKVVTRIEYIPDEQTEVYFKAADVLVLPYTYVFQSGVLFLGYNFGLPVIASDVGSLREDIVEGRTGFVCQPKDARSLEARIRQFFSSAIWERRNQARADIKRFADERYSWSAVAETTRQVYLRLLGVTGDAHDASGLSTCRSGADERPMPK